MGHELYYYTIFYNVSRRNYEIDFVISQQNKICPIEVKSSGYNTHKSLDMIIEKYSGRLAEKYLIYTKDLKKDKDITMLPIYMTQFL